MEPRTSAARSASVELVATVQIAMVEVAVVEVVAIDDRSAVRDVGVVVVDYPMAMPVASPVMPAPPKTSKEAHSKSQSEGDRGAGEKDAGYRNPARVG